MGGRESSSMYLLILILLIIISCSNVGSIIAETNILYQSDTLNSTQQLVSHNNIFILQFINVTTLDDNNNTYLAIYNSKYDTPGSTVWLANRNTPIINDSSPTLFIDNTGKLVINRTQGDPIRLCPGEEETSTTNNKVKAVLQDNGNLVLIETNSDGSVGKILWQSFDCPTDTLLPGMKLGINHRTGRKWSLTSWLASDDPSPGPYTLEWDPHGLELVVKRRGVLFWTSVGLKNNVTTDGDRGLSFGNMAYDSQSYNMTYASTSDEEFFRYVLTRDVDKYSLIYGSIELWKLFYNGMFRLKLLEDLCDGYKTKEDVGCAEWGQPHCRIYNTTFQLLSGNFFNKSNGSYLDGYSKRIGPTDCRIACWNDCTCQGYQKTSSVDCVHFHQDALFQPDPSGESPQFYVIQSPQRGNTKKELIAISVSMSVLLVFVIIIVFCRRWRKTVLKREKHLLQLMAAIDTIHNADELENDNDFAQSLKIFSFVSIVEATNNFSAQNKLGQGGFGPVYKGKLAEGKEIAVKRLSRYSGQGSVEFKNELILIAKLQHTNLVRLLGCCIHNEEKLLIYEYMPNKSLDSFLFDPSKRGVLDWRIRVMIIEGIAQGLLYLHQHSRLKIIHRDLKVSNILLDENMNPKISDFGLARIFKQNDVIVNTRRIVGTYGYMSPEYAMDGIFSIKSDVFSLGVIILEILSGKQNNSFYDSERPMNITGHAWDLWEKGIGFELMDSTLNNSCSTSQFLRFIQIALLCVEESPTDRPTISSIISMITNESTILPTVKRPAFTNLENEIYANLMRNDLGNNSINHVSISTMNGR